MRKSALVALSLSITLIGARGQTTKSPKPPVGTPGGQAKQGPEPTVVDYFPLREGCVWTYEAKRKKPYRMKAAVSSIHKNGQVTEATIEWSVNNQKQQLEEYRINNTGIYRLRQGVRDDGRFTPPLPVILFPLRNGERWRWKGTRDVGGRIYLLTADFTVTGSEDLTTPAGKFKAMHVHLEGTARLENPIKNGGIPRSGFQTAAWQQEPKALKIQNDYWFAPNVGLVQQRIALSGSAQEIKLVAYKVK